MKIIKSAFSPKTALRFLINPFIQYLSIKSYMAARQAELHIFLQRNCIQKIIVNSIIKIQKR